MSDKAPQVVVLVCCFNSRPYLDDCLGSLLASEDAGLDRHILVVDDGSTDGSGDYIREHFPQVECIRPDSPNKGFAGANNFGWAYIQEHFSRADFVVPLNVDTIVESGWLRPLVNHLEENPTVGSVQPKLRLHPQAEKLNTAGNRCHFLGFGFMVGYGENDEGQYDQVQSIDFASGAASMLRADLLKEVGLFDDEMYMYLEDAELAWKLRQIGYDIHFVPASVVYHKHIANAPNHYYYHLERNRWILLFTYYRALTLLLLGPAFVFMELGQLSYAALNGIVGGKLRSWGYFLRPGNLAWLWRRRRLAQSRRTTGDRKCMGRFSGTIHFPAIDHPLLRYVGNPILNAYWLVVKRLIVW